MKRENEFRYAKLANILREQILTGYIQPGQFLLSENELCRHYELSRSSVRKALDQLQEEGLIVKRVGQGTMVPPDLMPPKLNQRTLRLLTTAPSYFVEYGLPFVLDAFRKAFPQIEVKTLHLPTASFRETFRTSREMGFHPDLLFVTDKQYHEFRLEDQASFVPLHQNLQPELEAMYPKLVHAFGDAESLQAAPVSFSPVYLIYNPKMFERFGAALPHPGWTREDFLASAKMLTRDTDGDGIPDTCGFSLPSSLSRWPSIALRNGVRFQRGDSPDAVLRTLTFLHDLLYRYRVAALASRTWLNSEAFKREKSGMVLTTSFELTNWKMNGMPFEPKIAPMPFGPNPSSLLIANAFMIPNTCEDLDAAVQFLRIALSAETQTDFCRGTSFLSVRPDVNEGVLSPDDLQALALGGDDLNRSFFMHELLSDIDSVDELEQQMDLFWGGLESAESFANRLRDILE